MKAPASVLVFVTQYMPTGGIESHLREFCLHLVKSGVEVDLVTPNSSMTAETEAFFRQVCRQVYLGGSGRNMKRFIWLLLLGLKLNTRNYQALYTNGQGESIIFFSWAFFRRKRWIHHHHTAGDTSDQLTWGKNYWKTLQEATAVVACSTRNARAMEVVLKRSVQSIPCFSHEVSSEEHKRHTRLRFGYYGRLIPEKGIGLMCQLSEDPDLKEIEFHLWGEGQAYPPSCFEAYPNIFYHGSFSGAKTLTKVVNSLDAFLLLSTHPEGLPISLLEAMSAGLPWLATDQGGIPDIALDASSTRVIPVSATYSDVKAAVLTLAEDIQAGKVSKISQKELYKHKFSATALILQWKEIFGLVKEKSLLRHKAESFAT